MVFFFMPQTLQQPAAWYAHQGAQQQVAYGSRYAQRGVDAPSPRARAGGEEKTRAWQQRWRARKRAQTQARINAARTQTRRWWWWCGG